MLPHVPAVLRSGLGRDLLLAGLLWLLFIGLGALALRRLKLTGMTRLERLLLSGGLGAGLASLILLGLGLAGLWQPQLLRGICFFGTPLCLALALLDARRGREEPPAAAAGPHLGPLQGAALCLLLLAAVMNILATAAPETFYDALVYHLALPKLFLLRGRIGPIPENAFSGFPQGVEMLYGLALSLSNESLAALLHCSFGMAAALAVWALLRRYASRDAGILGALLFYLSPIVLYGSWQSGNDLGGAFYLVLALSAFSLAEGSPAWPVLAGMFLGLAMGVKYTFVPMAGAFVLTAFWLRKRAGAPTALKEAAGMATVAAAVSMPWLVKNVFFFGNPLYPFLNGLMGWTSPADWKNFLADAHSRDLILTFGTAAGWKEFLLLPWTISVHSRDLGDWPGLSFLLFIPWAFFLRWGISREDQAVPPAWTALALLSAAGYLGWCLTSDIARFLVMALPFASCLAALAIVRAPLPGRLRQASWALAILSSLYGFQVTFKMGLDYFSGRWSQIIGAQSRSDYLKTDRMAYGVPYYAAMGFINTALPQDAKVLFLGEPRGYYCERDHIAATVFDHNPFWDAARAAQTPEELSARLKKLGVTHLFVSVPALCRYCARPSVLPRDIVDGKVFGEFWERFLDKVFEYRREAPGDPQNAWLVVYRLREAPDQDPRTFPENTARSALSMARRAGL